MRLPAGYPIYEPPEVIGISDGDEVDSLRSELAGVDSLSISTSNMEFSTTTTTLPYTANDNNATNSDTHTDHMQIEMAMIIHTGIPPHLENRHIYPPGP
jgi:hypothetical protein